MRVSLNSNFFSLIMFLGLATRKKNNFICSNILFAAIKNVNYYFFLEFVENISPAPQKSVDIYVFIPEKNPMFVVSAAVHSPIAVQT